MFAYALTIFLGAFLLFQVEPIIGKYILPWFGGSPGVWTTCLLFFQALLLGGYAYAHLTSRFLKPKSQAWLHLALLACSVALLPIIPADTWKPTGFGHPTWQILALLVVNLGLPYLTLSATGPLVQEWYRRTHPGSSPYRLYSLSNAGSLLALASYPFLVEWLFPRRTQATIWGWGLVIFAGVCGFCAWRMSRTVAGLAVAGGAEPGGRADPSPFPEAAEPAGPDRTTPLEWCWWIALPALASVLLLATTNKLCQDLAVVPFLWVLPLGLYLVSFILCFDSPRWYVPSLWSALAIIGVAGIGKLLFIEDDAPLLMQVIVYSVALLAGCMVCHGELYRLRPNPRRLTAFYLAISAGGAIGGILVAVIAPHVFNSFAELPVGYWTLTLVIATVCVWKRSRGLAWGTLFGAVASLFIVPLLDVTKFEHWHDLRVAYAKALVGFSHEFRWWIFAVLGLGVIGFAGRKGIVRVWTVRSAGFVAAACLAAAIAFFHQEIDAREDRVSASRSFFGVLTVFQYEQDNPLEHYYLLLHGKITHGMQFVDKEKATWATTYYGPTSGVGRAINSLPKDRGRKLGLVGLGTGSLAAYVRRPDTMRIYEINPQVEQLAQSRFTYVPRAPGKVSIVDGDARLSMEQELKDGQRQQYDLLALDAFNSDAIPVHLLTREAFKTYLDHLAPDGIIAVHISNRYFDLEPVVTNLARDLGLSVVTVDDDDNGEWWIYDTTWMLLSKDPNALKRDSIAKGASQSVGNMAIPVWTDDYTALFKILR